MKIFICLLVLAVSANAGILPGDLSGGGGGYSSGGGLGHGQGHGQEASIIKVIHEQSSGYGGHQDHHSFHDSGPAAVIQVIHEEGPSSGGFSNGGYSSGGFSSGGFSSGGYSGGFDNHQHVEAAPQIVQVIHEDHGSSGFSGQGSFSGPAPLVQHVQVIHGHAGGDSAGFSSGGGYSYGIGQDHIHGGGQEVKIIKVIQQDQGHHHHGSYHG